MKRSIVYEKLEKKERELVKEERNIFYEKNKNIEKGEMNNKNCLIF